MVLWLCRVGCLSILCSSNHVGMCIVVWRSVCRSCSLCSPLAWVGRLGLGLLPDPASHGCLFSSILTLPALTFEPLIQSLRNIKRGSSQRLYSLLWYV